MSVAPRIRALTRWSLARLPTSVTSMSNLIHIQRRAARTEGDNSLEKEHCNCEDAVRTSIVLSRDSHTSDEWMDTLNGVQCADNLPRNVEDVAGELLRGIARYKSADRLKSFVDGRIVGGVEVLSSTSAAGKEGELVL